MIEIIMEVEAAEAAHAAAHARASQVWDAAVAAVRGTGVTEHDDGFWSRVESKAGGEYAAACADRDAALRPVIGEKLDAVRAWRRQRQDVAARAANGPVSVSDTGSGFGMNTND